MLHAFHLYGKPWMQFECVLGLCNDFLWLVYNQVALFLGKSGINSRPHRDETLDWARQEPEPRTSRCTSCARDSRRLLRVRCHALYWGTRHPQCTSLVIPNNVFGLGLITQVWKQSSASSRHGPGAGHPSRKGIGMLTRSLIRTFLYWRAQGYGYFSLVLVYRAKRKPNYRTFCIFSLYLHALVLLLLIISGPILTPVGG